MTTPELKWVSAFGETDDLENWQPPDSQEWCLGMQLYIGTDENDKSDSFDVTVCTPTWFANNFSSLPQRFEAEGDAVRFGASYVFMETWDLVALRTTVERLCAQANGDTWGNVANQLSRVFDWEYDYRYDAGKVN